MTFLQANKCYLEENYSKAIQLYTKVLKNCNNPKDTINLLLNRGMCYYQLELYKLSIKDFDRSIIHDPNSVMAYLFKGKSLWLSGKQKQAKKYWEIAKELKGPVYLLNKIEKYLTYGLNGEKQLRQKTDKKKGSEETKKEKETKQQKQKQKQSQEQKQNQNQKENQKEKEKQEQKEKEKEKEEKRNVSETKNWNILPKNTEKTQEEKEKEKNYSFEKDPLMLKNNRLAETLATQGLVQDGMGNPEVDKLIALGYLLVNKGFYNKGIVLFNSLIVKYPNLLAVYIGKGTCHAMLQEYQLAVDNFTKAIKINPNSLEAYKRRGQTRSAMGLDKQALSDLTIAFGKSNETDFECSYQRGIILHKLKNYSRAIPDFEFCIKIQPKHIYSWNFLGLSLNGLGETTQAIVCYERALSFNPNFKEALTNLAQINKDLGNYERSLEYFERSLKIDPTYYHAQYLSALNFYASGRHRLAADRLLVALKIEPSNVDALLWRGAALHAIGDFEQSFNCFNQIVLKKPEHIAWYNREMLAYWVKFLDQKIDSFSFDKDLHPQFKEFWCKKMDPKNLKNYNPVFQTINNLIKFKKKSLLTVNLNPIRESNNQLKVYKKILKVAEHLGRLIQINMPGFMKNLRQHRVAGLAMIMMTQKLKRQLLDNLDVNETLKKKEDNENENKNENQNEKEKENENKNENENENKKEFLNWREWYDIGVKWRQVSEPMDPVFWVDLLTEEQFKQGFGSHTPMFTGQCKVVRYYAYFDKAFSIFKELFMKENPELKKQISKSSTLFELYSLKKGDFYVVTPCQKITNKNETMDGTRLTIQFKYPEGLEFSIRTPGTPPRLIEYSRELSSLWESLHALAKKGKDENDRWVESEKILDCIIKITFYWYNFMPLSRGTAAIGYIGLISMLLAFNFEIKRELNMDVQLDWEAILEQDPNVFKKVALKWLNPNLEKSSILEQLPQLDLEITTLRNMIQIMILD
ncbi:suppressor of rps4-rld 1 [Anaeramoeba flamelloides]|uniref:Suppressor of rps4-rld 1 n=1 Tax=Anaeramoeba flamelloides TaxID=1746091 RepID=A0ABQ8YP58_9EUKA|nr:suppressor of rps4-rld 1 [Anaeramoeba flamelloides]